MLTFSRYSGVGVALLAACGGPSLDPFAGGTADPPAAAGAVSSGGGSAAGAPQAGGGFSANPVGGTVSSAGTSNTAGGVESNMSGMGGATAGGGGAQGGSSGNTGLGGDAGPGVVVPEGSLCRGHTVVPQSLLANCEAGAQGWFAYLDDQVAAVLEARPGAADTQTSMRFKGGSAKSSGVGFGLFCDDVSSYQGVSFWAKGKGGEHMRFLVAIPETDAQPGRGDCNPAAAKCNDHPGKPFVLDSQWKQFTVSWSELKQYGWGSPAEFAGIANSLLWINDGPVENFDFAVDEVRLVPRSR